VSTYRIYKSSEIGITDNGATLTRYHGCDGENHVDEVDAVFFSEDGKEVIYADHLRTEERGLCDGTCSPDRLGGFIYPVVFAL
jgi:hypothetical protein